MNTITPTTRNAGRYFSPLSTDPVDMALTMNEPNPVYYQHRGYGELTILVCGYLRGLGFRNVTPSVGSPPGFCLSIPAHTELVIVIICEVSA